jgi:hypothetical protein
MLVKYTIALLLLVIQLPVMAQQKLRTKVLVIGGGTSGTSAAIQSARLGANTILIEEGPWLGGMISAAGVSAIDGNHKLPSGIWNEFREAIYKVYGGPGKVATGWVSNTQFEPHVADSIFKSMAAATKNLEVKFGYQFASINKKGTKVCGAVFTHLQTGKQLSIEAEQVIDATELGDVLSAAGARFDVGMEASDISGEDVGVTASNNIIQDFTYVATLKDYGGGADNTIAKPANYDPAEFDAACTDYYVDRTRKAPNVDAKKMLEYGKLPHGKYMINWPAFGNDYYANMIAMSPAERKAAIEQGKQQTLRFVYFIQQQLGFKNLGLADDEFPTSDRLAIMPYHRESRRVKGLVRFNIKHVADRYAYNFYRTGIAVGDYPIDHHHAKNTMAPKHINFYPVPSYNIPLGSIIPAGIQGLVVAEKSISVSNIVNGTTRLQPVVLLIGQAAGTIAALAAKQHKQAASIPVREVQQQLLESNALLMPFIDAGIHHPQYKAIQRIGVTGILKGKGIPFQWANQTWFYPDSTITEQVFLEGLQSFNPSWAKAFTASSATLTTTRAINMIITLAKKLQLKECHQLKSSGVIQALKAKALYTENIQRKALAWLLDTYINPFNTPINHQGKIVSH